MSASVETWSGKDRTDENFPVGSALIAPRLRPHVHAFYAFARNADDIADSPSLAPGDKLARLDAMEAALLGEGHASPSGTGLRASLAACGVTDRHARDLLVAFRRDATKTRYADWDELYDYCRHSAMPVGRHVLDLHDEPRATWAPSDALCASLQVLNHLQDMRGDLDTLDRCYMPLDRLGDRGVDEIRADRASLPLRRMMDTLLDYCDALNAEARALPRRVRDRRLRLETGVIVGLAHRLAGRLRRGDPLATRVRLRKIDAATSIIGALRFL